ncbi:MAG: 2Fe-2S iron-sulfur cluster-binding protein [Nitrospirota bacterium]|nr:2Fe-2S iron-sulfur cluster-binding protein [Nitrospirota bacterium]
MPKVTFITENENTTLEITTGKTILDIALDHDIDIEHNCGGNCACTTCHVIIREGMAHLSEMEEEEEDRLDTSPDLTLSSRLACQALIKGDCVVEIPKNTQAFRKAEQH